MWKLGRLSGLKIGGGVKWGPEGRPYVQRRRRVFLAGLGACQENFTKEIDNLGYFETFLPSITQRKFIKYSVIIVEIPSVVFKFLLFFGWGGANWTLGEQLAPCIPLSGAPD